MGETLRPSPYRATASYVRRWIVPTLGHKKLDQLTPPDLRTLGRACLDAGLARATAAKVTAAGLRGALWRPRPGSKKTGGPAGEHGAARSAVTLLVRESRKWRSQPTEWRSVLPVSQQAPHIVRSCAHT